MSTLSGDEPKIMGQEMGTKEDIKREDISKNIKIQVNIIHKNVSVFLRNKMT